jgi:alanine-synthesizing transaminase
MKKITPADRTKEIRYAIRDIVVRAKAIEATGKEMLYLNIGDPNKYGFAPPKEMVENVYSAMKDNKNGYAPSSGTPDAVEAIAREAKRKGIENVQDIFVTTGASEGIEICLSALVNEGDNFLTPNPGYPLYTALAAKIGAEMNPYYLDEENGWQPDVADIEKRINDKTRAIVLINPNNPTGSNCNRETLEAIMKVAKKHNIVVFADEIYDKLLYDEEKHVSIASIDSEVPVITFGGLSKNYLAPGWRIGWGILSGDATVLADYKEAINKLLRARLSANHPEQYAIAPILDGDHAHIDEAMVRLKAQRDITFEMLNAIDGISCVCPKGAFYAFPKIDTNKVDMDFVKGLLEETGVVVVPGSGFGQKPGTQHFRVVFLPPLELLKKAYENIGNYWKKFR